MVWAAVLHAPCWCVGAFKHFGEEAVKFDELRRGIVLDEHLYHLHVASQQRKLKREGNAFMIMYFVPLKHLLQYGELPPSHRKNDLLNVIRTDIENCLGMWWSFSG